MVQVASKCPAWFGWLLVLLVLSAGLGQRDPSPPDEPRFALAARTMVQTGEWLVPHRGVEAYAEKPPVFMWMQAAALALTCNLRVAFLLPSLLAALATLALVWHAARWLWSPRIAPWAAGALAVCLQFGLQAKRAQIDMVLVALTTLGLCALLRYLLEGRERRWLALGLFACGLGTVTKGVGFLPVLVLLPWLVARRTTARAVRTSRAPAGDIALAVLAFAAGAAVWLLPLGIALLRSPDPALHAYAHELLFRQTATRYMDAWHHVRPAWYYLQVMATLWLPGILLLPWLLPAWWHRLRRGDPRYLLLLGWAALVLLFFSASSGKREVYLFPALPALCLAAAPLLPAFMRRTGVQRLLLGWIAGSGALLLAAGGSGLAGAAWATRVADARGLEAAAMAGVLWTALALGAGGLMLAVALRQRAAAAVLLYAALVWTAYGFGVAPALDASSSGRALMRAVDARIGREGQLGAVAWREQHLLQAPRGFTEFGWKRPVGDQWRDAAHWVRADAKRRWLWLPDSALGPCVHAGGAIAMGRASRQAWWLVPGSAVRPACEWRGTPR